MAISDYKSPAVRTALRTPNTIVTERGVEYIGGYNSVPQVLVTYGGLPAAVIEVTGITLAPTTASIVVAATRAIVPTVAPANATNKTYTVTSSNPAVATVSATGVVTAVSVGTATITFTTNSEAQVATCAVTVTAS